MPKAKGFTLIELLVVISIIAVLSMVGLVAFQGVRSKAQVAQRVANIDAIKKAYETNYDPTANGGQGGYKALAGSNFASGKIPTPNGGDITPTNTYIIQGSYVTTLIPNPPASANFAVCVNKNDGLACYAQSSVCYCQGSTQGTPISLLQNNATSCDPSGNLLNGLVGYWKFDEGSGTTTADFTGNGGYASLVGPTWSTSSVNASFNKALSFVPNNYVSAPQNSALNNITNHTTAYSSFTLSLWVKPTYTVTEDWNFPGLLQKGWSWLISGADGCLRGGGIDPSCTYLTVPSALNSWTNIVLTYNPAGGSNNIKSYTQGVFRQSKTSTGNPDNISNLLIGGPGGNSYFKGLIDDVRVYKRVLTDSEIGDLYGRASYPGGTLNGSGCIP